MSSASSWPTLPALPDPATRAVLGSGLLEELSYALGGPFHFLLPDAFDGNLRAMRSVLEGAGVDGFVYFAKKANKATVWSERCAANGAGVDVASVGELRDALGGGVPGEHLVVTGPAKDGALLRLAVRQGALVAVDALDELDAVLTTGPAGPARPACRSATPTPRAGTPSSRSSRAGTTTRASRSPPVTSTRTTPRPPSPEHCGSCSARVPKGTAGAWPSCSRAPVSRC
ncbi:hypothetical protein [Streptomyces nigrescens]